MSRHREGFTLIEVVIAALIITVMAAGMFGAFVGARYIFRRSRHKMQAFNFAREVQDKLRSNYIYTDSQMSVKSHIEAELGSIIRGEMASLMDTQLTYDVSEPALDGYKKVTVRVNWDEISLNP